MELHERLAALAAQRGREVFAHPDGLRAALEDFLDEQSASVGELNLLVDAVRLGGLAQVESNLQRGADPAAAVAAAGDFLARQRGTTDLTSCQWACAALGFALGLVPDQIVRRLRELYQSGSAPAAAQPTGWVPPPQPWAPAMVAGPTAGWSSQPAPAPKRSGKGPIIAAAAAVAALLIGGGIAWAVIASDGDSSSESKGGDEPTDEPTDQPTDEATDETTDEPTEGSGEQLEGQTPEQIRDAIMRDMAQVSALNMSGNLEADDMTLDISMDTDGRCQGTMTMQDGRAEIVSDGTDMYMKGNEAFWIESSGEAEPEQYILDMFTNKWVRMAGQAADAGEFCDLDSMLEEFVGADDTSVDFTVGGTTIHNGVEALELTSDEGGTMLVSNDGPFHILKLVEVGAEAGEFRFSRYNEELDLNIPTDYVDIPK